MPNTTKPSGQPRLVAALLVVSALLFVVGVSVERAGAANEAHGDREVAVATQSPETHTEGGAEGEGAEAADAQAEAADGEASHGGEVSETFLGLNLESPWLVGAFALASLVLAVAVLRFGRPALLVAILMAGAAMILDLREVLVQVQQPSLLLIGLAVLVAVAHAAVVIVAALAWLTLGATRTAPPGSA